MLKWLAIFAGVVGLVVAVVLMTCKYQRTREDQERNPAELSLPAAVSPSQDSDGAKQNCKCTPQTPCWYILLAWPQGITVWAVILTFAVIGWQADETRKAAKAALKQADIQAVAMRQWVNIVPIGIGKCVRPDKPGLCEVSLRFEIINKTNHLMTILRIETNIGADVASSTKSVVECNQPLVPQKSDGDSSHPFYAKTLVDSGIWNEKGRIFVVTGTVTYLDCMEVRRTQAFNDLYLGIDCGELRRMKPSGIGASVED